MTMTKDVYQIVTDKVLAKLEQGVVPWRRTWHGGIEGAYNGKTKKPYSLLNQMLLEDDGAYLTFNQVKELGGKVNKGAKSEIVVFWKMYETKNQKTDKNGTLQFDENGKPIYITVPVLKYYNVFKVSDTTLADKFEKVKIENNLEPEEAAEEVISKYLDNNKGLTLEREAVSNRAYYSPLFDKVVVPAMEQYDDISEYYATMFHELTHSTGHHDRLDRFKEKSYFGDENYSKEELVAELGAAFLCNMCGIEKERQFENNVAYLKGWLSALKNDKRLIVIASAQAEKAVKFIRGEEQ